MAWGCSIGALAGLLAVAFELVQGEICEYNQATEDEDCTTYSLVPFLLIQVGKPLNDYGVAITALATVAIGFFTLTLKLSTDKLWEAAKDQIFAAENAAKIQSADMNASIAVAKEAADAAKQSAEAASASVRAFIDSERGRMFISKITLIKKDADDPQPTIDYAFVNAGRSTVVLIQGSVECTLLVAAISSTVTFDATKVFVANTPVGPEAIIGSNIGPAFLPRCSVDPPLSATEIAKIANKQAFIFFKGFIRYRTGFNDIYRRNFACIYGTRGEYFTEVSIQGYNEEYREPTPK